jgi:hypothetical protein
LQIAPGKLPLWFWFHKDMEGDHFPVLTMSDQQTFGMVKLKGFSTGLSWETILLASKSNMFGCLFYFPGYLSSQKTLKKNPHFLQKTETISWRASQHLSSTHAWSVLRGKKKSQGAIKF